MDDLRSFKTDLKARDDQISVLQMQVKILADRLALVVALFDDEAIETFLVGDDTSSRWWEQMSAIILADDDASTYKQAELRGSDFYGPAKARVRGLLRRILKSLKAHRGQHDERNAA